MSELQLLRSFYATVPEPDSDQVAAARTTFLQLVDPTPTASRRRLRLPRRPGRGRVLVLAIVAGLLLAGVATATYVGVRRWIAAYQTPATSRIDWVDFTLGPGGRDLYAIRVEGWLRHRASAELVRIRGIDHPGRPHATRVFDFDTIAAPGWRFHSPFPDEGLGIAANGDIFLLAAGLDSPWRSMTSGGTGPFVVFVRRRDNSRQMILSAGELVRSGALPANADYTPRMAVTAPSRIWFEVEIYGPWAGTFRDHSYRFLEIIDPNADGNWSDAVIRPLAMPRSLPVGGHGLPNPWRWLQIARDPTASGNAVLASALGPNGDFRVYRIADPDPVGTGRRAPRVRLVFEGHAGGVSPQIAPLPVDHGDGQRIAFAGLTDGRVTIASSTGPPRDIGGSFPTDSFFPDTPADPDPAFRVLADGRGHVYAVSARWEHGRIAWHIRTLGK